MLSEKDIHELGSRGISPEAFKDQLDAFVNGFPPLFLDRPAVEGDGILVVDPQKLQDYINTYHNKLGHRKVIKFVPASGAATRMFKDLFSWQERIRLGNEMHSLFRNAPDAAQFFGRMKEFAFWEDLSMVMYKDCLDADHLLEDENYLPLIEYLLSYGGLNYSAQPKGLLKFHRYPEGSRTAMEEHLAEGAAYARQHDGKVLIHFTVSPEHESSFRALFAKVREDYQQKFQVEYELSFSVQKPSTDTVAVDLKNQPLRDKQGNLVFRPGGHGALIENLNDLDADIIFIKNIDNVVPDHLKESTIQYKKVLAGLLLTVQQSIFSWLEKLDQEAFSQEVYEEVVAFCARYLNIDARSLPQDAGEGSRELARWLNRPIRVCGMVKNIGEPGGGPFWVRDPQSGNTSLQIVESSQVNMMDPAQAAIMKQSTHFNPVDIVCSTRDYKGNKFNLHQFIDPQTGFISRKSKNGESLKALELPGLWNGAMAHWITLFVEVPLSTFNPVKTINDLLRPEHL